MHDPILALIVYLAHQFGGSTGWAIVTLSVGIRVALLPLTIRLSRRAMRGQKIVRKLQPEVEQLKKKFEKKPERLFEETMKLYREHGYSPFDLPAMIGMFVQFPIFAMLYRAIGAALVSGERFYWIRNLASPDGWLTIVVVLLTAAGAYFVPNMSEGTRALMIAMQVGITLIIVWKLAAGYGLYWVSSSAIGLLQTLWLRGYSKQMV
ncbi:MAG TPA: YidC/Oxa1 family membrane protein insertase [Opitutus sp.]|nr:YidC/Oxa1 family membrane protein insertase [Opitutus sp.]